MFSNDARARGEYVAPPTIQVMNDDGTVKETITINEDGLSATTTQGGVMGVPTGAPDGYAEKMKKFTASGPLPDHKAEGEFEHSRECCRQTDRMIASNGDTRKETKEKTESKKYWQNRKATKSTSDENKKPESDKDAPLFDKDFARNMRGAFM